MRYRNLKILSMVDNINKNLWDNDSQRKACKDVDYVG